MNGAHAVAPPAALVATGVVVSILRPIIYSSQPLPVKSTATRWTGTQMRLLILKGDFQGASVRTFRKASIGQRSVVVRAEESAVAKGAAAHCTPPLKAPAHPTQPIPTPWAATTWPLPSCPLLLPSAALFAQPPLPLLSCPL
ncbi:hypothetical protein HaLaN_17730 [Haematococcus lacustris]|uniref:Uncharacterized protein n=1 Tax=Haematococcus lacustris TaxID=44745 RepID=A0A699ZPB6_HAELA|nr:hypothetical protein HaLaN_17730 [Haematococcus lacustris]